MKKIETLVRIGCWFIILGLCALLAINVFQFSYISFDGGWNAQVAANYAATGKYATTWPKDVIFYPIITTGQTMLIPTAWVFELFGVSFETIAIVPLCYMTAFIILLYILIRENVVEIIKEYYENAGRNSIPVNLISLTILILMWSVLRFSNYSFDLCGEGATMCFITAGLLGINKYKGNYNYRWLLLCGFAFVGAMITKLVSICFVVVALAVLTFFMMQNIKIKDVCILLSGMLGSFVVMDFIKFIQLGYSIRNYIDWWIEYFKYNFELNQADRNVSLIEKMLSYESAFQLQRYWGILALGLGICILAYVGIQGVFKKKWVIPLDVFICGLGGVSYILVSIFISKGGALWTRRLVIHFAFFLLYLILICLQFFLRTGKHVVNYGKKREIQLIRVFINLLGVLIISVSFIPAFSSGARTLTNVNMNRRAEQQILWQQIAQVSQNAKLVTYDWRFASAISTLNNMDIVDMNEVDFESGEKYYYISDDYLVQEVLDAFEYDIVYQRNEESLQPCIVELIGAKNVSE